MEQVVIEAIIGPVGALMVLAWVVSEGRKINADLMSRQEAHMSKLIASYEASQKELMELLKTLCLQKHAP